MFPLSRSLLKFTAASSLLALTAISTPTHADEMAQNLGPVGAHEPILTTVGNKRVIAFYEPDSGRCAVNAIVYDKTDAYTGRTTAARNRLVMSETPVSDMVKVPSIGTITMSSLPIAA